MPVHPVGEQLPGTFPAPVDEVETMLFTVTPATVSTQLTAVAGAPPVFLIVTV
jgi:hypothetical protein